MVYTTTTLGHTPQAVLKLYLIAMASRVDELDAVTLVLEGFGEVEVSPPSIFALVFVNRRSHNGRAHLRSEFQFCDVAVCYNIKARCLKFPGNPNMSSVGGIDGCPKVVTPPAPGGVTACP